jgi:hypothetical protein
MKKIMLMIAGLLLVSVMAVNAQVSQDTTQMSPGSTQGTDQSSNLTKDMEVIQSADVPASLKSTLQGSEYSGWEQGKVYRNTTTNEYLIVIGDEDAKVYRFDANGSRIEDLDKSDGSGSSTSPEGSSTTPGSSSTPGSTTPQETPAPGSTGTTPSPTEPAPSTTPK